MKSWRVPEGTDTHWQYKLSAAHYNELAGTFDTPRYLFLIVVPPEIGEYTHAGAHGLTLRRAGYWGSFRDVDPQWHLPPTTKVTVKVPKANLLTVESVLTLMTRPDAHMEAS